MITRNRSVPGQAVPFPKKKVNLCFGCGEGNPGGMHLKFVRDAAQTCFASHVVLSKRYQGPPGYAHGGIIATMLDEAMSKVNTLKPVIALTRRITVDYLRPVPLGRKLVVEGWKQRSRGRHYINRAEIRDHNGVVMARGRGWFIAINPSAMFPTPRSRNAARSSGRNVA